MAKPNFFICGFPKCGTTTLYHWVKDHPSIFMPSVKEPFFENRNDKAQMTPISKYEILFQEASPMHKAIGDASTNLIYSAKAVQAACRYSPDCRFVVCLRDPVELAISFFNQRKVAGLEPSSSIDNAASVTEPVDFPNIFGTIDYINFAKQGFHLNSLINNVGSDRVMCIYLSDMQKEPDRIYMSLLNFLDIESVNKEEYRSFNQARSVRNFRLRRIERWVYGELERTVGVPDWLRKAAHALNRKPGRPPASPATRAWLRERLADDVVQLETLTGRDLTAWREQSGGMADVGDAPTRA